MTPGSAGSSSGPATAPLVVAPAGWSRSPWRRTGSRRRSAADDDSPSAIALRDQLERAFGRLSPEQRATVVLHFYLGLTLDEAAETLGIPTGTMRSRLNRALQAMRAAVEADDRSPSLAAELVQMTTSTDPFDRTLSAWLESLEARSRPG